MTYKPELDGLRALSMLLVVVYHMPLVSPWLPGGFIGVDVFFVLSGALITQLLLAEEARTKTVTLGRFYWRRSRRLYPAMLLMLALTTALSIVVFPHDILGRTLRDAAYCSVYLGMLPALWGKVRFFGHAWSLSIEEAFYLVWPAALLAVRKPRARLLLAFLVVLMCEAQRLRLWFALMVPSQRVWVAIDTRAGAIALGCIVGLAMHAGTLARARSALVWTAPVAAALLLVFARVADRRMTWYATWGYPAVALLATIVVARLLVAPSAFLALPALVWLGKLSYSIYLWHVPLITIGDALDWPIALSIAVSFVAAWLSYRFVETPLRARAPT